MATLDQEKLHEYWLFSRRTGRKPFPESGELAFLREEALEAIRIFRDANFPVLGGDVYEILNGEIRTTYDNWHVDPNSSETRDTFVRRSLDAATKYVRSYPEQSGRTPLFVLVASEPNTSFSPGDSHS